MIPTASNGEREPVTKVFSGLSLEICSSFIALLVENGTLLDTRLSFSHSHLLEGCLYKTHWFNHHTHHHSDTNCLKWRGREPVTKVFSGLSLEICSSFIALLVENGTLLDTRHGHLLEGCLYKTHWSNHSAHHHSNTACFKRRYSLWARSLRSPFLIFCRSWLRMDLFLIHGCPFPTAIC